jgi:hypothetical protein
MLRSGQVPRTTLGSSPELGTDRSTKLEGDFGGIQNCGSRVWPGRRHDGSTGRRGALPPLRHPQRPRRTPKTKPSRSLVVGKGGQGSNAGMMSADEPSAWVWIHRSRGRVLHQPVLVLDLRSKKLQGSALDLEGSVQVGRAGSQGGGAQSCEP